MKKLKSIIALTIAVLISITMLYENSGFVTTTAPSLKMGSSGSEVKEMQQRLINWGYYNKAADGNFDRQTYLAVAEFQKSHGLKVNGTADRETLMAMGLTKLAKGGTAYAEAGDSRNVQLLARAINGEARGEPYEGQVAVGAVIINRTRDPKFPKTIPGVIYQPGAFTAVSDGQINVSLDPKSTVVKAARDALNGWDPTNGCIYYWNPATATSRWIWSRTVVKVIGKHYFGK